MEKSAEAFRTISEVAVDLALPQHVLRFWETRFPQIRPLKRAGGRRYYRPADIGLLRSIRHLLYDEGYTIKGVQRLLKEGGMRSLPPHTAGKADETIEIAEVRRDETNAPETGDLVDTPRHAAAGDAYVISRPMASAAVLTQADREDIRDALACIEECGRILEAALPRR